MLHFANARLYFANAGNQRGFAYATRTMRCHCVIVLCLNKTVPTSLYLCATHYTLPPR